MPWKNGGGTTTEIVVEPPGAALDAFVWRVSMAEVRASGPFSTFPGCNRILVQTKGAPMTLTHDGGDARRLSRLEPYGFAGERLTDCTLEAPPARDFNVMVRRDRARARVSVHELGVGACERADVGDGEVRLIHVLGGALTVAGGGWDLRVDTGETLMVAEATPLVATATSAVALCVAISPAGWRRQSRTDTERRSAARARRPR